MLIRTCIQQSILALRSRTRGGAPLCYWGLASAPSAAPCGQMPPASKTAHPANRRPPLSRTGPRQRCGDVPHPSLTPLAARTAPHQQTPRPPCLAARIYITGIASQSALYATGPTSGPECLRQCTLSASPFGGVGCVPRPFSPCHTAFDDRPIPAPCPCPWELARMRLR
ncbi:hypothetical protein FA95DRAFT_893631 [Auriscalpium vulgare]|uniref:Uncharacterized protein n=1 Tax=Auriscalpium vulgare TaxID=40419 RepID=A0ACB8RZP4_9AGAM|nr:hypothetical protein FA95DRAFT_893631 [Auriscalpium vulgare]